MRRYISILVLLLLAAVPTIAMEPATATNLLRDARCALMQYDLETASAKYAAYQQALKKAKLPIDSVALAENRSISRLRSALENVEDVLIVDSIAIPLVNVSNDSVCSPMSNAEIVTQILKYVKLPVGSGKLTNAENVGFISNPEDVIGAVFCNADGNSALFSSTNTQGRHMLYEATRLANGKWEINPIKEIPAPAYSPFLLDDGLTLYYISDNHSSLGGRDIMMSVRDAVTEPWREPVNIGMPFNSPADELLFAMDATDSVGWFVTCRNSFNAQMATLYVFMPSEIRRNLSADDDNIRHRARISSIADTWPENFNPLTFINRIDSLSAYPKNFEDEEFVFILPNGKRIVNFKQLPDHAAKRAMSDYLSLKNRESDAIHRLNLMYETYGRGDRSNERSENILTAENNLNNLHADLQRLLNKLLKILGFK